MKAGITVTRESGRISPVFERAECLLTLRLCRSGAYTEISRETLPESESGKLAYFREKKFHLLICGALCNETLEELRAAGLHVIPFVSGTWESVAEAAFKGGEELPPHLVMPGCCGHHKKCCQKGQKNENCRNKSR